MNDAVDVQSRKNKSLSGCVWTVSHFREAENFPILVPLVPVGIQLYFFYNLGKYPSRGHFL